MKKRHIAVLMSLLFAAPAAVIALAQSESSEATAIEIQAAPAEPVIVKEEVTVVTDQSGQPVAALESTTVAVPVEVAYIEPKLMSTAEWLKMNSFRDDDSRISPAQIAYFDRLEQGRRHLVANARPTESGEELRQLPAQTAYFDRLEQQRLASLQPQQPAVARVEAQQEVVIADSSAIR